MRAAYVGSHLRSNLPAPPQRCLNPLQDSVLSTDWYRFGLVYVWVLESGWITECTLALEGDDREWDAQPCGVSVPTLDRETHRHAGNETEIPFENETHIAPRLLDAGSRISSSRASCTSDETRCLRAASARAWVETRSQRVEVLVLPRSQNIFRDARDFADAAAESFRSGFCRERARDARVLSTARSQESNQMVFPRRKARVRARAAHRAARARQRLN